MGAMMEIIVPHGVHTVASLFNRSQAFYLLRLVFCDEEEGSFLLPSDALFPLCNRVYAGEKCRRQPVLHRTGDRPHRIHQSSKRRCP